MIKVIIVFVVVFFSISCYALEIGHGAPDFQVVTLDGKEISYYKDIKEKRPVYLIFWSTW